MADIQESLDYLLEVETQQQRLDKLIRQGMLPARQLPILHRALANIKMGKILTPYEREALSKLLDKMMGFQFGDDITYNRARLHTQKTKYQTEEKEVAEEEEIVVYKGEKDESEAKRDKKAKKNSRSKNVKDNGEDEKEEDMKEDNRPDLGEGLLADLDSEGKRARDARRFKRLGRVSKEKKMKLISKALRKEKEKTGVREDILKFNEMYKTSLEKELTDSGVDNVRDIPVDNKKEFFNKVEEGSHATATRPADKSEGDKESPKQGGSVKPEITDGPKQDSKPTVKEDYLELKKSIKEGTYSKKQIKMAKGIAFDKRHKGGDMTGAYKKMEKIKKGLGDTPEASKALRQANEELEQPLEEGKLKDFAMGHGYFDDSGEGKRKRADKNWLSKQAGSKKTIAYPKKQLKSDRKVQEGLVKNVKDEVKKFQDSDVAKQIRDKKTTKGVKPSVSESSTWLQQTADTWNDNADHKHPNVKKHIKKAEKAYNDGDHEAFHYHTHRADDHARSLAKMKKEELNIFDTRRAMKEGAKADAFRDMKSKDATKGMAPLKKDKPAGTSKYNSQIDRGPEHIVPQLRKAVSLGDKHKGVQFQDGKTKKVAGHHAQKFLDKHDSMKPAQKADLVKHAHASHDNFKTHVDK